MSSGFGDSIFTPNYELITPNYLIYENPQNQISSSFKCKVYTLLTIFSSRVESDTFALLLDRLVIAFHFSREPKSQKEFYAPIDGIEQKKYEG